MGQAFSATVGTCCASRRPKKWEAYLQRSPKSTIPDSAAPLPEARSAWPSSMMPLLPPEGAGPKQSARAARTADDFRFLHACRKGELILAKKLQSDNGVRTDVEDKDGAQAIHWACFGGQLLVLEWLHDSGVPLDVQTSHGAQPIHWACYAGQLACAQWLIEQGIALDVEDAYGQQPVHWANRAGQLGVAKWLHEQYITSDAFTKGRAEHAPTRRPPLSLMSWVDAEPPGELGLRWQLLPDRHRPKDGSEFENDDLATAIVQGRTRFSTAEWARFGVQGLRPDHFLNAGGRFYKPVSTAGG